MGKVVVVGEGIIALCGLLRLLQAVTKRVYLEFEKRGSAEKRKVTGVQGFGEPKAGRAKTHTTTTRINT
jgi:hypothetical protein